MSFNYLDKFTYLRLFPLKHCHELSIYQITIEYSLPERYLLGAMVD